MFAVIYIPDFALQSVLRHKPELIGRSVGLISGPENKASIIQLTESARRAGVCAGLTAPQALARCPEIVIKLRSPAQEQAATEVLLQCAYNFSPRIEATADGVCTMDLKGLPAFHVASGVSPDVEGGILPPGLLARISCRDPVATPVPLGVTAGKTPAATFEQWAKEILTALAQLDLRAQIGLAETPQLARHAARCAKPFFFVENASEFISALPIESLEAPPEMLDILQRWGIRTVGAFTALGKDKIAERLGPEAVELFERASTSETRPLTLVTPSEDFSEAMDFEMEIERLDPLLFILRRFIEQLSQRIGRSFRVIADLNLRLTLASAALYERHFSVPAPTGDVDVLFRMLQTHLENVRTDAPIISLRLTATPSQAALHQFGLFEATLRDPNQFHHTLARLTALCGSENVGTPVLEDSFRPDAFRMETPRFEAPYQSRDPRFQINPPPTTHNPAASLRLRRFRPAFHADVEVLDGRPAFISSLKLHSPIEQAAGPWRSSGNWWEQGKQWLRDAWDIRTRNGALYRIYEANGDWFLEGVYD